MKIKNLSFILIIFLILYVLFINKNAIIDLLFLLSITIFIFYHIIKNYLKWNKNKKHLSNNFDKLKIESFFLDLMFLSNLTLDLRRVYRYRSFNLEYFENKIIPINNFKDFIDTYNGVEKIEIYLSLLLILSFLISILQKFICRGRLNHNYILSTSGELINFNDLSSIKEVKIEDSFFGFSKKLSFTLEEKFELLKISNSVYSKYEDNFKSKVQ